LENNGNGKKRRSTMESTMTTTSTSTRSTMESTMTTTSTSTRTSSSLCRASVETQNSSSYNSISYISRASSNSH
jgi:hypothetical protein